MLVTGGASNNATIAQILADVFNCDVYTAESTDSAAIGGALRARHGSHKLLIVSSTIQLCRKKNSTVLNKPKCYI